MNNIGITIIDVMRDMSVEPTPELSWTVGDAVRDLWYQRYGILPEKQLRPKTYDQGSHCFAIYPESMRATIVRIIDGCQTEIERQGKFDF
jgi:hypothetical protein